MPQKMWCSPSKLQKWMMNFNRWKTSHKFLNIFKLHTTRSSLVKKCPTFSQEDCSQHSKEPTKTKQWPSRDLKWEDPQSSMTMAPTKIISHPPKTSSTNATSTFSFKEVPFLYTKSRDAIHHHTKKRKSNHPPACWPARVAKTRGNRFDQTKRTKYQNQSRHNRWQNRQPSFHRWKDSRSKSERDCFSMYQAKANSLSP